MVPRSSDRRAPRRALRLVPRLALTGLSVVGALIFSASPASAEGPDWGSTRAVLRDGVAAGAFPGCAVAVGTSEGLLWQEAFGRLSTPERVGAQDALGPARVDTVWDLASLTKVVGTTSVVLALVRDGRLGLDDAVVRWVPELVKADEPEDSAAARRSMRVEHLLTHTSGLPAWSPIWRERRGLESVLEAVLSTALESPPGVRYRYSDLGFILLGEVAARAGGEPLAVLERELVFEPLGMATTLRSPPAALESRIAPTEIDPTSGELVHGVVHDENARAAGGGTGHAGLFSTADDVGRLATELLRALRGEPALFPRALVEMFTTRREAPRGTTRALGWDTPSDRSSSGRLFSARSFGHTGFTGTSVWIDPERNLWVVLLTNRVHPSRESTGIFAVRPALADAVVIAVESWRQRPILRRPGALGRRRI